jgi:hypothetical protein
MQGESATVGRHRPNLRKGYGGQGGAESFDHDYDLEQEHEHE